MKHPTTKPENRSMEAKVESLTSELESLEVVRSAGGSGFCKNAVTFNTDPDSVKFDGDLPNSVLRVLAENNCMIPKQQPDVQETHVVIIEIND